MKKFIFALTLVLMSLSASAKDADRRAIHDERMDSICVEYLNDGADFKYPHWFINNELGDKKICVKYGDSTYVVSRKSLRKAYTGKRLHGNYYLERIKDGRKVKFYFENYVENDR